MISHNSYRAQYEQAAQQAMQFAGAWRKCLDELDGLMSQLKGANELLRSAHSIASRDGLQTNWRAFERQVAAALETQHKTLTGYFDADAASFSTADGTKP